VYSFFVFQFKIQNQKFNIAFTGLPHPALCACLPYGMVSGVLFYQVEERSYEIPLAGIKVQIKQFLGAEIHAAFRQQLL